MVAVKQSVKKAAAQGSAREPRSVGRPRSEASRRAILEAALGRVAQVGYARLTMEGIAAAAGVGKQTVYRWWRSRAEVVLEALRELAAREIRLPDEGALREDVERFLRETFSVARTRPGVVTLLRALMAEAQLDATFAASFRREMIDVRRAALRSLFERAVERGELPASTDLDLRVELVYGAMWYRMLLGTGPLDRAFAAKLAERATAPERGPRKGARPRR